jgi:hypothetical protein
MAYNYDDFSRELAIISLNQELPPFPIMYHNKVFYQVDINKARAEMEQDSMVDYLRKFIITISKDNDSWVISTYPSKYIPVMYRDI